jgi:hypothetical protein
VVYLPGEVDDADLARARVSILVRPQAREQAEDGRRCPLLELIIVVVILFMVFGGYRFSRR